MSRHDDALDPLAHPERWERLVDAIVEAGEPHLAARREEADVASVVVGWARPALSAAAAVLVLLAATAGVTRTGGDAEPTLAAALVPDAYAAWLVAGYDPTVTELVSALEEVEP